jgi:hypothetical protein
VRLEYVEFNDQKLWHYGLTHVPAEGFKRGRTWVAKGREAASESLIQQYHELTGDEPDSAKSIQQFFTERRARTSARAEAMSANCWQYVGMTWFDCGPNWWTGCETLTDYGNYRQPYDMRYNVDYAWCFPVSYPYPSNCESYNVATSWATSDPCF